jgi:ferredoxin--NADP+ reductase
MFEIIKREVLAENIVQTDVQAPRIAASAQPGQFVIVRVGEKGERIPLTISDYNREKGWITLVTQVVGDSSRKIYELPEGASFTDVVGPLGHPSEFVYENVNELKGKNILFIAGGLGTAPVYPQVKWLAEQGAPVDVIVGAKNKNLLIFQEEMRAVAKNLYIATDDGSEGFHGLVTDLMKDLIDRQGKKYDVVVAIGPMIMMKFVALATKPYGIKTIVSLNSLMVDGTGMCGACRVNVGGKIFFTCVDGPEFNGHLVDFDEAMRRQNMYRDLDARIAKMEAERQAGHKCKVGLDKL